MRNLDYVAVGKRIKRLRKKKGYSQKYVADAANLSDKYISEIEGGKKEGRLDIYVRIATVLDVSLDEFITDFVPANSAIFEHNINNMCKDFGKTRKEMLLDYIELLADKEHYDHNDDE